MGALVKLRAVEPIEHDGKAVAVGETFSVPEEQAEQLVSRHLAKPAGKREQKPGGEGDGDPKP